MVKRLISAALWGIEGVRVTIEVDVAPGLPGMVIVGLPDQAIRESRDRVRMAVKNSGFDYPLTKVTVNLAPADLKKEGSCYDLPVALGILWASGKISLPENKDWMIIGELSLDGSLRPVKGLLPLLLGARKWGIGRVLVPAVNLREAGLVDGIEVVGASHFLEAVAILKGEMDGWRPPEALFDGEQENPVDLSDIRGQTLAKRAMEIAAAGGHHLLMVGPPGTGKTLLAKSLPGLLPPLNREQSLEATKIYSVAELLDNGRFLITTPPFRSPHHSISRAGFVGGGGIPRPGEISLAHHGVLFLDEAPEFPRSILDSLRQPMEDGRVTLSRVSGSVTFPCRFQMMAAMNPCPCGFYGSPRRPCTCSFGMVHRYRQRISGPVWDRIDLKVELPDVPYHEMIDNRGQESSETVRERVVSARAAQTSRNPGSRLNSQMPLKTLETDLESLPAGRKMLEAAVNRLGVSPRGYVRILGVARTIADLEGQEKINENHLAEALQFRVGWGRESEI